MCRSIKVLRRPDERATPEEISAAALQFVRKVSGYRKPSRANQAAFDGAVEEISKSVERLLGEVSQPPQPPRTDNSKEPRVLGRFALGDDA
jgi:hypothetical protein